ncbi:MAG TPA: protein phosphatase 2C domain-containing protein [Gemmataceae bacterium]
MRCKMDCAGLTDVGRVRQSNEDQFLIADLNKSMLVRQTSLSLGDHTRLFGGSQGALLLVADGMGGNAAGKQASALAVQTLEYYVLNTMPWFFHLQEDQETDLQDELKSAMEACQHSLETAAAARPEQRGMGTTLTMAYLLWPRLYVVHVGDSRCYLCRLPRLMQITTDQTMAQRLVEQRVLTPEESPQSRWSHVLWSCLGGHSRQVSAEVYKVTLALGDTLLLCTDGLTGQLRDEELLRLLQQGGSAEETCRRLVAAATDAGGSDNITVVVARFLDARSPEALAAPAEEKAAPPRKGSEAASATEASQGFVNAGVGR